MATGGNVEDNTHLAVDLEELRDCSSVNDINNTPELFFAASLKFLHRLLIERTTQCAQLDFDKISTLQEQEHSQRKSQTYQRHQDPKGIDRIERYRRQLRYMKNLMSMTHVGDRPTRTLDRNLSMFSLTDINSEENGDPQVFENTKSCTESCDEFSPSSSFGSSVHLCSFSNRSKLAASVLERSKINTVNERGASAVTQRKMTPDSASDLSRPSLLTQSVIPPRMRVNNNKTQRSFNENSFSDGATNCGNKHNRKKNNFTSKIKGFRKTETTRNTLDHFLNRGTNESEVESEIGYHVHHEIRSDIPKQIPVDVQLEPETRQNIKTVTLLVKVPSTICHILNRKNSKQNTKMSNIDPAVKTQTYEGKKKRRLTSVLLNLLKGRRTHSSATVSSTEDKLMSNRSISAEGKDNITENIHPTITNDLNNDGNRDTLIYMLKKSSKNNNIMSEHYPRIELFYQTENNNKPIERSANCKPECVDTYENLTVDLTPRVTDCGTKPWNEQAAINVREKFADDESLIQPEVQYNRTKIIRSCTNGIKKKMIPLHFSEGSPQLGKMCNNDISQRDIDMFLNIAEKMGNTKVKYDRNTNNNHVEIPVQIKTTETPLHLHKTRNSYSDSSSENSVFQEELISSHDQTTSANTIQTEEFIRTLYRSLPEGTYFLKNTNSDDDSYSNLKYLISALNSVKSKPPEDLQQPINNEDSALEFLLRHIATGSPMPSSERPAADSEKDTIIQTAPKRQSSKISVCCSSESLSNSDHEVTDLGMKYLTIGQDECRVQNYVLDNGTRPNSIPEKSYNRQTYYSQARKQNYIHSVKNDRMINDKSESSMHPSLISYNAKSFEKENSELKLTFLVNQVRRKFIPQESREVKFEEKNCRYFEAEVQKQIVEKSERRCPTVRETERTIFCSPVLSKQIHGEHKELADALIRWWGPQINYSTTPSSQTQISTYSVSINNLL